MGSLGGGRGPGTGRRPPASPILAANISNAPVELVEHQAPVRIERYALAEDSGGCGPAPRRTRRGAVLHRAGRTGRAYSCAPTAAPRHPTGCSAAFPAGPRARNCEPAKTGPPCPPSFVRQLAAGQSVRHVTAGGGGYGDPMKRPPERVLADVIAGKVFPAAGRRGLRRAVRHGADGGRPGRDGRRARGQGE